MRQMPQPSTIAARCAAVSTSIARVIPDISSFARRVRDSRHDLNAINNDLLIIRTGLGVAQDDFSASAYKLPTALANAFSQILDSCDDTSERLHKGFLKLSCSKSPKDDWDALKDGNLINLRHDLNGSKIVLELALDYIGLFGQQDTLDSFLKSHVSDLVATSDDLLKRTDKEEIHINLTARDRLPSLLQAVRLLRSCITAMSRDREPIATSSPSSSQPTKRTTTPRPDSLEPSLGEARRSGRISPSQQTSKESSGGKSIGTWLANVPCFEDASPFTHSAIKRVVENTQTKRASRSNLSPARGTFYTDDGVSSSRTLVAPESRLRKSRSWCSDLTILNLRKPKTSQESKYASIVSSSDVSVFHQKLTSDKIAVTKANRKDLDTDQRAAVDRILANIPAEATAAEVERVLWEGANPMATHPEFGFFFIRAAYEMSPDVLKVLLDFGADITRTTSPPNHHYSAMHAAALGRQLDTLQYLVSLGHSIDCENSLGETPLHLAVRMPGAYEIAKYLLEAGADVNYESKTGSTPLHATLNAPKLEGKERGMFISLLRAHGAEGEVCREMDGRRGDSKGRSVLGIT